MTDRLSEQDLPLQRITRWERECPDKIFFTQPHSGGQIRDFTWAQTMGEVRRMAAWLKAQGWAPGERVAILGKNCAWWIMADLAIWMAGYVSVPVYPSLRPRTVRQILDHSGAKACFVGATDQREISDQGVPEGMPVIRFVTAGEGRGASWDSVVTTATPLEGNPTRPGDELCTIIYTSGTTGMPKGVMHSFAALALNAKELGNLLRATPDERFLSYLPLAHIVERAGMEGVAIYFRSHVYFTEGIDSFVADLRRARPTIFLSVPRLLMKFQQAVFAHMPKEKLARLLRIPIVKTHVRKRVLDRLGLDSVRLLASGSAPLAPDVLLWYRNLGLELVEGFGMTEVLITHLPPMGRFRPGYVGPPLAVVETRTTEAGELLIRSPMNMLGYYNDPQATRDALTEDGFMRTGDLVSIAPDGQLKITGRVKEQFKTSKGKYVAPAPIESLLIAHPALESCCLLGGGLANPFAVVILSEDARRKCAMVPGERQRLERDLKMQVDLVNAQLDPHERVSFLAVVDDAWSIENGLITPTLKIRRNALEDRYLPFVDAWKNTKSVVVWQQKSETPTAA
jgi:long-chain acyl-CoA synthetase